MVSRLLEDKKQSLGLGLGLETKVLGLGLGLETKVLSLGLGLETKVLSLGLGLDKKVLPTSLQDFHISIGIPYSSKFQSL